MQERLDQLTADIKTLDSDLRMFMAAEKPDQGIAHAGEIHRLRQAKLQKRLEMEYCRGRMRSLRDEGRMLLQ